MIDNIKIRKIKTIDQYNQYCDLVEAYINIDKYSAIVETIIILIEEYDNRIDICPDLDPIELLQSLLSEHNLSILRLSQELDIDFEILNLIINKNLRITDDIIQKLCDKFKLRLEAFNRYYILSPSIDLIVKFDQCLDGSYKGVLSSFPNIMSTANTLEALKNNLLEQLYLNIKFLEDKNINIEYYKESFNNSTNISLYL